MTPREHLSGAMDRARAAKLRARELLFRSQSACLRAELTLHRLRGTLLTPSTAPAVVAAASARARAATPGDSMDGYPPARSSADLTRRLARAHPPGRARTSRQPIAALEERERLARDLHDTVVQDLISVGLQLVRESRHITEPDRRARHLAVIDQLDEAIQRLREIVLGSPARSQALSEALARTTAQSAAVLCHQPVVTVEGPIDTVPEVVGQHVLAVVREALSNVARHAQARHTIVAVTLEGERVTVCVEDDGIGLPEDGRAGHGIPNMLRRAELLGGSAAHTRREPRGTRMVWTVPLAGADVGVGV